MQTGNGTGGIATPERMAFATLSHPVLPGSSLWHGRRVP
jgi:hypothetical protein